MTSETGSATGSGQESMVIARFDSYRRAEHMLASLRRGFGRKARKGGAVAVVVRGNPDGSVKVTESGVLTASDLVSVLMRVSLAWMPDSWACSPWRKAHGAGSALPSGPGD